LRAAGSDLLAGHDVVTIAFEGRALQARRGESLAAALAAHGVTVLRETRGGAERGIFCGMGVCQDCLVTVDGVEGVRACLAPATPGSVVTTSEAGRG
jgi:D-hydroxyproline dehydrogenase subunit alpha